MIWSNGKILPDDGLTISILDRTFEHGLGLFETFRTWGGRPTLLDRHKARLLRSAGDLQLPIDPASLPDESAVRELLEAEGVEGDRLLRITATGGTSTNPSVVWMKSGPLPEPMVETGASLLLDSWQVSDADPMARHKTLNYWSRRRAFEEAKRLGFDEALSGTSGRLDGDLHFEGSRTNLFLIFESGTSFNPLPNQRPRLLTSSKAAPIVPGILRELVLEIARNLPIEVEETSRGIDATWPAARPSEVFLTNSVRGIIPVGLARGNDLGPEYRWPTPGPWTRQLQEQLVRRVQTDQNKSIYRNST